VLWHGKEGGKRPYKYWNTDHSSIPSLAWSLRELQTIFHKHS
jgi:hypothetical protein